MFTYKKHSIHRNSSAMVINMVTDIRQTCLGQGLGVYLLQSDRHIFSNKTTDPNCRLCQLEVEDTRHVVTRCPAYNVIRTVTTEQLKKIIIDNSDIYIWKTHFSDWESFLRIIICPDIIQVMIPQLSCVIGSLEAISRDYFYKVHTKRLFLMKQQV